MAQILVIHPGVMTRGGAEAVCLSVLETLQDEHDVTLLTTGSPSLSELNEYFGTTVSDVRIHTNLALDVAERFPASLARLRTALMTRVCQQTVTTPYDIVINTRTKPLHPASAKGGPHFISYLHHPHAVMRSETHTRLNRHVVNGYDRVCNEISPETVALQNAEVLANSQWTAQRVRDYANVDPQVVYPPIDTTNIEPSSWEDRSDTILTIGRIVPKKRVLQLIEIVTRLRDRGHDVRHRIVGPEPTGRSLTVFNSYADTVRERASKHDFVHFEETVSRERLTELIATAKYGLHGMEREHFGIAVAELVAGGAIPFVPRSGGQMEIVEADEQIMYDTIPEAVEKMDRVMGDDTLQRQIRSSLPDIEERFGRERFQAEIERVVEAFELSIHSPADSSPS